MAAVRVDVTNWASKARLRCPHLLGHSDWRVHHDRFYCASCGQIYELLVDQKTGDHLSLDELDIRGGE